MLKNKLLVIRPFDVISLTAVPVCANRSERL